MRKTYRWFFVLGVLLIFSSLFALASYSFQTFLEYFLTCAEGALGFSLVYMGFHFRKQYYQAQKVMTAAKAAEREAHARELSLLEQQLEVERVELEQLKAQVKQEFGDNASFVASVPDNMLNKDKVAQQSSEFQKTLESIPPVDIEISETDSSPKAPATMPDIHFYNVTRRTNLDNLFPLVVIDTETTGLKPRSSEIIEVSAIRYEAGFKPVSCFTTLLRSRKPISPEASAVNNITDDMVKDQPYFSQIADAFSEYISGCTIVGHNLDFDLKFLCHSGVPLPDKVKYIDTLDLAKHTLTSPRSKKWDSDYGSSARDYDYDVVNYKLGTLCDYYGIVPQNAHRSLADCLATGMVLECLIEDKTK